MSTRSERLLLFACSLAAGTAFPRIASSAPTKEACIEAFDKGQRLRREGALRRAREELLTCSQQECPGMVRADCAGVLRQVDAAQPTIVLKAADRKGVDLTDATVDLEGEVLTTSLDGRAVPVDPGKLVLVFKRPPWDPVTVNVVVAENEKGRIVRAVMGPIPPAQIVVGPPPPAPAPAPRGVVGWAVPGGLALLGVGALVFAGVNRIGVGDEADELRARCGPTCPQADRNQLSSDLALTNVALGVGIGSLALAAAAWFVFLPKGSNGFARARVPAGVVW